MRGRGDPQLSVARQRARADQPDPVRGRDDERPDDLGRRSRTAPVHVAAAADARRSAPAGRAARDRGNAAAPPPPACGRRGGTGHFARDAVPPDDRARAARLTRGGVRELKTVRRRPLKHEMARPDRRRIDAPAAGTRRITLIRGYRGRVQSLRQDVPGRRAVDRRPPLLQSGVRARASDRRRGRAGARREGPAVRRRLAVRAVPDLPARRASGRRPRVASRRIAGVRHALGDAAPRVLPPLRPQEAGGRAACIGHARLVGAAVGHRADADPARAQRARAGRARSGGRDAAVRAARAAQAGGAPAAARAAGRRRLTARRRPVRPAVRSPTRPSARRWPC
ncbi:hypothetical protein EMIT0111MI5_30361 [Burkholderia sp. IT-111MI5]